MKVVNFIVGSWNERGRRLEGEWGGGGRACFLWEGERKQWWVGAFIATVASMWQREWMGKEMLGRVLVSEFGVPTSCLQRLRGKTEGY